MAFGKVTKLDPVVVRAKSVIRKSSSRECTEEELVDSGNYSAELLAPHTTPLRTHVHSNGNERCPLKRNKHFTAAWEQANLKPATACCRKPYTRTTTNRAYLFLVPRQMTYFFFCPKPLHAGVTFAC